MDGVWSDSVEMLRMVDCWHCSSGGGTDRGCFRNLEVKGVQYQYQHGSGSLPL